VLRTNAISYSRPSRWTRFEGAPGKAGEVRVVRHEVVNDVDEESLGSTSPLWRLDCRKSRYGR
jgi:hypothetical protein